VNVKTIDFGLTPRLEP